MLVTVHRADGPPRGSEVPLGSPLTGLTGPVRPDGAVLLGGYHGTWLAGAQAAGLTLDNHALAAAGARVGAGLVLTLPAGCCGLVETAAVVRYLALESAGQCGPCLNGLPRIAEGLAELAGPRPRPQVRANVERWAGLVTGRGACSHPDGTSRFVRSALAVFSAELRHHAEGLCSAASRRPFLPLPPGPAGRDEDWS